MFIIILITVVTGIMLFRVYQYKTFYEFTEKLPGRKGLPFIGNAREVGLTPVDYFRTINEYWKEFGNIFRLYIGAETFILCAEPKDVEVILSSVKHIDKMDDYKFLHPWLGNGLLTSTGQKWHKHRKVITPSFHFQILTNFLEIINEDSNKFMKLLEKYADGKTFDIQSKVTLCTLDVICETAMGVKINALDETESELVTSFSNICNTMQNRFFSAWKRIDLLFYLFSEDYKIQQNALNIILPFTREVIRKRKQVLEKENQNVNEQTSNNDNLGEFKKRKMLFLDTLLTSTIDNQPMSDNSITDEVSTFIFEGHDTTASGISFAIYNLSKYPAEQQKIYDEQQSLFGKDMKRDPTYQEIQEMPYLDLFLKETLRIYPSVPVIGRLIKDTFDLNGKLIPGGASVVIFIYAMGKNPKVFQDPERFWPERFLPENRQQTNPYENVSFSAGPRNCVGQKFAMLELKAVIAKLVRTYQILPSEDTTYEPVLSAVLTLKSDNGINVRLRKRID